MGSYQLQNQHFIETPFMFPISSKQNIGHTWFPRGSYQNDKSPNVSCLCCGRLHQPVVYTPLLEPLRSPGQPALISGGVTPGTTPPSSFTTSSFNLAVNFGLFGALKMNNYKIKRAHHIKFLFRVFFYVEHLNIVLSFWHL